MFNNEYPFGIKLKDGKIFNIPPKLITDGYYTKNEIVSENNNSTYEIIYTCTAAYEILPMKLAYAITIHKSQGSEFDTVIMVIPPGVPKLLTKNLLYTGISRAKKKLILILDLIKI